MKRTNKFMKRVNNNFLLRLMWFIISYELLFASFVLWIGLPFLYDGNKLIIGLLAALFICYVSLFMLKMEEMN